MPVPPRLPAISHEPISVVLLAHNAASHLDATVNGWLAELDRREGEGELIVVDDGSADDTARRLREIQHPRLRVIVHEKPQGVGAALKTGLDAAQRPLVFYTLCDPVYRPDHLILMLDQRVPHEDQRWIDQVHLISGFRAGTRVPMPLRVLGWLWRTALWLVLSYVTPPLPGWLGWRRHLGWLGARVFFGVRYQDVTCPVRLLRREILARSPLQSTGPMAHTELIAKVNFLGCILGEEVSLDVSPGPYRGDAGDILREARKLFKEPDFGPVVVPTAATPADA